MTRPTRLLGLTALAATAVLITGCTSAASGTDASAEPDFPAAGTTIDWIVPSAAGAGNDILARILAPVMSEKLGATINVVNREGGNQVIGLNELATSTPDGTTIGFTNIPSILGRYLDPSKQAGFDRESFSPIGSFALNDIAIGVNASSPYGSIEELFDAAEAKPGEITVGTDSRAGDDHVNLRIIEKELDLDFNIVHYNSGADKIAALVSGEIDFALGGLSSLIGQQKSGEVDVLTVIAAEPSTLLPDVPTIESEGYDLAPMTNNFAISAAAGTPDAIMTALQDALEATVTDPEVEQQLTNAGTVPAWIPGAEVETLWEERETVTKPIIDELIAGE
ncbi:tripartite tricarboxylate transporter substrate binding protein [Microbacteriaceae bacterium VKM Ac-2854]|nr:tripartite tricarboxylate transporter substrate binding protein [Microbacteriaceae bacterium VKM Ac-2854]